MKYIMERLNISSCDIMKGSRVCWIVHAQWWCTL